MDAQNQPVTRMPDLAGEGYTLLMERLHAQLRPQTYLEIGTQDGKSLRPVRCRSVAIDPMFRLPEDVVGEKPSCLLFRMTSDAFFADYDPVSLLRGRIDFAFLDGMHLFEFVLRDFRNVERSCRRNSVVLLHDCIPSDVYMAERDRSSERYKLGSHPGWWTGDVWKAAVALRKHRPDLVMHAFDARPTGLIAVTNLDFSNAVLDDHYFDIVRELSPLSLETYGIDRYWRELAMTSTRSVQTPQQIAGLFWL